MGFILSLITNFILIFYIILTIINNKKEREEGNRLNRQLTEKYLCKVMTLENQIQQQNTKSEQNKKIIYKGNCIHCGAPKRIDLDYCDYCDCAYEEELQSYDDIPF